MILPCFVCGKALEDIGSGCPNHARGANEFCTYGQYGSTKFDPMDGSRLAVNICDQCLMEAARGGRVAIGQHGSKELTPWSDT